MRTVSRSKANRSRSGKATPWKGLSILLLLAFFCFMISPAWSAGTTGTLSGTVTDKATVKGVEEVFVSVESPSATYTATTDKTGFFAITGVLQGTYTVNFSRVGYQTTSYTGVLVSADASTNLQVTLSTEVYKVKGVTVKGYRAATTSPREMFTNYEYSNKEVKELLPGPASLSINQIYANLPGVVTAFDAYSGYTQHIRGGTGLTDVGYAFDGVPTNDELGNAIGNFYTNVGTAFTQFYVGAYPAQYGNFLSGYINQVVPRGYGPPHGSIEAQYGFWLDPGNGLPSYDPATSALIGYNGWKAYNPFNWNLVFEGQSGKFHYYFNHISQSIGYGSTVAPFGVDLKPALYFGGTQLGVTSQQIQDNVMNLNYDLDADDEIQLMMAEGAEAVHYFSAQELPCNPTAGNFGSGYDLGLGYGNGCVGPTTTNTNTGVNELYNQFVFTPTPNQWESNTYDLEKLEYSHRFSSGTNLTARLWRMNTHAFLGFMLYQGFPQIAQPQDEAAKGGLIELRSQINPVNLIDVGAEEVYSGVNFWNGKNNPGQVPPPGSPTGVYYDSSTGLDEVLVPQRFAAPDVRTEAAWLNDEIRPFPKLDINVGLRWDSIVFLEKLPPYILTNNGNPFAVFSVTSYAKNLFTNCVTGNAIVTGAGICADTGLTHPSYITPRIGASYQLTDSLTLKAGYGKFVSYPASHTLNVLTAFAPGATTVNINGVKTPLPAGKLGALTIGGGSKPQFGESLDFSVEYGINDATYLKVTPYIKHINNAYQGFSGPGGAFGFINAGTIESQGIETILHTKDWNGLTGFLSWTYSNTKGTQLNVESGGFEPLLQDAQGCILAAGQGASCDNGGGPGSGGTDPYFSNALLAKDFNAVVPVPYDIRNVAHLLVNYKTPDKKWEISPTLSYESGMAYGLGANNLRALYEIEHGIVPTSASQYNPLGETTPNSLRMPGFLSGDLSVTYHWAPKFSTTFTVFNLWNSGQVFQRLTDSDFLTSTFGYPYLPTYDPTLGQYGPIGYPSIRQFYFTAHWDF